VIAWCITKSRYAPYDGTGAMLVGARWSSSGREVIYASDTFAGAILERLVHALRPRTLPGPHHAVRIDIPHECIEAAEAEDLPGWDARDSPTALAFGDRWLDERRSAVLLVPSVPSRPIGKTVMINPHHPDAARAAVSDPFTVPWDERLF
jgi:RES domain-containing protein